MFTGGQPLPAGAGWYYLPRDESTLGCPEVIFTGRPAGLLIGPGSTGYFRCPS